MTRAGGGCWRQATFWPFYYTSKFGRGLSLRPSIDGAAAGTASDGAMQHPFLVLAVVMAPERDEVRIFAVNRHLREEIDFELAVGGMLLAAGAAIGAKEAGGAGSGGGGGVSADGGVVEWVELRHDQLSATNTEEAPDKVRPRSRDGATVGANGGVVRAKLAPASWNMLRVRVRVPVEVG